MRGALLSWVAWAGALQAVQPATSLESLGRVVGIASVLASFTVIIFNAGRRIASISKELAENNYRLERLERLEKRDHEDDREV